MKRTFLSDNRGQSALFDAVLFLVIMIIASSMISIFANQYSKDADLLARENMMNYARDSSEVVLGATLDHTWYEDINGNIISKPPGNIKVMNLILEELYLTDFGLPIENFVLGYEQDIKVLIRNLVISNYHFALRGTYTNPSNYKESKVFISDLVPDYSSKEEAQADKTDYFRYIPKNNLACIIHTQPMIGKDGEAELCFFLWR